MSITLEHIQILQSNDSFPTLPALSVIEDVSLIYVERRGTDRLFDCVGRAFMTLAALNIDVLLTSQSCAAGNFRFVIPVRHAFEALNALKDEFADEFESGEVILIGAKNDVALVVQQVTSSAPTLYDALAQAHVTVLAAQGSPTSSVSVVIDKHDMPRLISAVQPALDIITAA